MNTYYFTLDLIQEAGRLLEVKKQQNFCVSCKNGNPKDILTSLDVELGEFITNKILAQYPDHSIHNEEAVEIAGNGYQWAIDPIDGTASFARGIPQYAISIGLLKDGMPILGAVLDPCTNELFSFRKGEGAWMNGEMLQPSAITDLKSSYVLFAAGRKDSQCEWAGESYKRLLTSVSKIKTFGSSALWLCYVAAGRVDGVVAGTFSSLDIAAAVGILNEVGGVVCDREGHPLEISNKSQRVYVANNQAMAGELIKLLESS